ncbi:MAG: roadblock/LC7 domain-containing protein [Candidatus Thermoplasmatota archaeon]|jgi:predicted regulator of Ras-like GTPase activity (Roadblock/LC7/MglB family)|nr:roadblock/LC7 domain-containing protein [Candidatus Thermoplasmatota archaeon]MCL5963219.1 roadblock/LC7 domain-containing protein [Candidatus Thermoplasmatota archaeon]
MRHEQIEDFLKKLTSSGLFSGMYVVSRDGMPIFSKSFEKVNTDTFSAMSAVLLGASDTITTMLMDDISIIYIRGEKYTTHIYPLDERSLFISICNKEDEVKAESTLRDVFSTMPKTSK